MAHFLLWINGYWSASSDYVRQVRQDEGSATWEDLEGLVNQLRRIESRRSKRVLGEPSESEIKEFLQDERSLSG